MHLDSTTVVGARNTSTFRQTSDRLVKIDMGLMQNLPKLMGNTDPLHFVKLLAGVQTNSESDSGIHIQGCDAAHNEMSVGGVPLFGVNHMLGLFSIFNPEHYSTMNFSHSSTSNRLGGTLKMELPDTLRDKVQGSVSVGIMSSQGSVGVRLGKKSHLRVSARQSYLDLLYGRWLKLNDNPVKYGFGDYNLTYLWDSGKGDKVWVDGYFGMDKVSMKENLYDFGVALKWGNYMGALHWNHKGEAVSHNHRLYSSGYLSDVSVTQLDAFANLPSYINAAGYKGDLTWKGLKSSWDVVYYHVKPQSPVVDGVFGSMPSGQETQDALEASLGLEYNYDFASHWNLKAGAKGSMLFNPESGWTGGVSPDVALSYNAYHLGKFSVNYNWRQQYIFQTGLSNVGFPIEFWFVAGKYSAPQYSQNLSLSYDLKFMNDMFALTCDLYYKRLFNQIEYKGDLLDLFLTEYDLMDCLLKGRGWNYGLNMMLHKQSGAVTGWVSYSLGRALRKFDNPEYPGIYPANHERIHELNAVCSYKYDKWDFSGTFIYASGLPFTAPNSFYISSGKVIASFGDHNACRMRPYVRLDLSVSRTLRKDENQENGINFSLYNVLCRRNEVMYRLYISEDNNFAYRSMAFGLRLMPSISYYHKF